MDNDNSSTADDAHIVQLKFYQTSREQTFAKLNGIHAASKNVAPGSVGNFLARCEDLGRIRDKFEMIQENITRLNPFVDAKERLEIDQIQTSFEDLYYGVKSIELDLKARLNRNAMVPAAPPPPQPQNPPIDVRLPKLEIPTWSGDLDKFHNFFALFNSLVHEGNYSGTVKLSYLRKYLEGPPLALIQNLTLTDQNYAAAYALIEDRYGDPRGLAAFYVNKMLDFSPLTSSASKDLQSFLDVFQTTASAFQNIEMEDHGNFIMFQLAHRALPAHMRTLFERSLGSRREIPTFEQLVKFVETQNKIEELTRKPSSSASKPLKSVISITSKSTNSSRPFRNSQTLLVTPGKGPVVAPASLPPAAHAPLTCPFCSTAASDHKPYQCSTFLHLPLLEKRNMVRNLRRCFRCLGSHMINACKSQGNCRVCSSPSHHTTLHDPSLRSRISPTTFPSPEASPPVVMESNGQPPACSTSNSSSQTLLTGAAVEPPPKTVLLGSAQALIRNKWGKLEPMRMVIDPGSQISLASRELTKRLGLPITKKSTAISGALSQNVGSSEGVITCSISPKFSHFPNFTTEAVVVSKVCRDLPTISLPRELYDRFKHLKLADQAFHEKGPIDFLLGAPLFSKILSDGSSYDIIHGEPAALNTIFGYVILGDVSIVLPPPSPAVTLMLCDEDLDRTLQSFWQIEEISNPSHTDPDHAIVENQFSSTHFRRADGSFVVRLPFNTPVENIKFYDIEEIARRRWFNLEARLRKNEKLRTAYHDFMSQYLNLGHMRPAPHAGIYYIPHFAITRNSSSSPIRVVFHASCKDASGSSLNQHLYSGPPLQNPIGQVITLFRLHPIAVSTDIRMMYRKIWVADEDTKFQHIFWRPNEDEPLKSYELRTLTYGTTAAPYLAIRCLLQNCDDFGENFPRAATAIRESTYIDDIVFSVASIEEATSLKRELTELLSKGCFELRKWASNSESVLSDIPLEHRLPSLSLRSAETTSLHILGVKWVPNTADVFTYEVKPLPECRTKRQVSSYIASIFDPLGWVAPTIFTAKLFMREIWERTTHWDEPLPEDIQSRWAEFSSQLSDLSLIEFPRLLIPRTATNVQLIGFCDASSVGYAACIYLRTISSTGEIAVRLITSKSRVAPLKVITIPRLELLGALQLAKLLDSVKFLFSHLVIDEIMLFSDSSVVLGWLKTAPHRLQTFVANRVVTILELTNHAHWHHIRTACNIADSVSRGLYPSDLVNHSSWWAGPSFLYEPISKWPMDQLMTVSDLPEMKKEKQVLVATKNTKSKARPFILSMIENSSRLVRLKRVIAWMLRFIHNIRQYGKNATKNRMKGPLQPEELQNSIMVCVKATQRHYFSKELKLIQKGKRLNTRIARLTPFLHEGIIRVGGRLSNSLLPYESKHPILLPKEAHLSLLICDSFHRALLHAGPQACQAAVVQEYWILSLRSLLRQRIFACDPCYRQKIDANHPVMADLPASRITPCRPFSRTSVDFAGPLFVKDGTRRNAPRTKAYICIFVCMVTKAVHIELVGSLSTDSYTAALTRFTSRRGLCREIHCDNGTNFVGAANENKLILDFLSTSHKDVTDLLSERQIKYHFNTPDAPWTGGLHEAAVKSAKRHLYSLTDRLLTYEEMATVLTRIEAILNSRPLTPIGDSPDSVFISPGHFLVGGPLLQPLEYDLTEEPLTHLSRWQQAQQASQLFWKRWSANYLHTLMERQKWTTPRPPFQVGDVVIMLRNNSRPLDWPLGRIVELFPGPDGTARSALVKTATGVYKRPVAKLASLPPSNW